MINTVNTKEQQLKNGYFKTGSGKEVILVVGSCRSVPYMNYFQKWNELNGDRFTIAFIDPFNFCYDLQDNRIDQEAKITSLETDEAMLSLFKSVKYFVHEHYSNFGMFNCDGGVYKNIYHFGLDPEMDICIPNWNNFFVLFGDIVSFDNKMRQKAMSDYNVLGKLSRQTEVDINWVRDENILKFTDVCRMSDVPEMGQHFIENFETKRFFWSHNHVSKNFTTFIFDSISKKMELNLGEGFYDDQPDMYANNYTYLSEYDNFDWGEEIRPLKTKLF